jgi:hypothetical protein
MDLGLERAGLRLQMASRDRSLLLGVFSVIGADCRGLQIYGNVKGEQLERVDLIAGGISLPDISLEVNEPESPKEPDLDLGRDVPTRVAKYDRESCSWRTSQLCLSLDPGGGEQLAEYSATWPESGFMLDGRCFPHVPWVPHTCDAECSLWPTPTASDWKGGSKNGRDSELKHFLRRRFGGTRPHPQFVEELMGFPTGWTELESSETRCIQMLPSGSDGESLKQKEDKAA